MCRQLKQRRDCSQSGLTLIEILLTMAITGLIVGGIATFGVQFFKMRQHEQALSRNHFNFSPLVDTFYRDVHASSGLASTLPDNTGFALKKAGDRGLIHYRIASSSIQRGESTSEGIVPSSWGDLTNPGQFMVQSGSFAFFDGKNTPTTSPAAVRRIDLQNLVMRQVGSTYTDSLSLVTAYLKSAPPPTTFTAAYAILAGGDLTFSGNPSVHSTPPGKARVHANQDVELSGPAEFSGTVEAVGKLQQHGNPSGELRSHVQAVSLPSYTASQIQALANSAKAAGTTLLSDGVSGNTLRGYFRSSIPGYDILNQSNSNGGTLKLDGENDLNLEGTIFVEGKLDISGNVRLSGKGRLICTEPVRIDGQAQLLGPDHSSFALVTLSNHPAALTVGGNATLIGIAFAPNGGGSFAGTPTLNGSVILGGSGHFSGTPTVNYSNTHSWILLGSAR